jgi:hypothetical protein
MGETNDSSSFALFLMFFCLFLRLGKCHFIYQQLPMDIQTIIQEKIKSFLALKVFDSVSASFLFGLGFLNLSWDDLSLEMCQFIKELIAANIPRYTDQV